MPDSPKTRLLQDKAACKWLRAVLDDPRFVLATDVTMLQLTETLARAGMPEPSHAAMYQKLLGADMFRTALMTIATPLPNPNPSRQSDNLNYNA